MRITKLQQMQGRAASRRSSAKRANARAGWMVVLLFVSVPLAAWFGWSVLGDDEPTDPELVRRQQASEAEDQRRIDAWLLANELVLQKLPSPGTAEFGWQSYRDCVQVVEPGVYRVRGWVDAQNRFGAKIRSQFGVTLTWRSGRWDSTEALWIQSR